MIVSVMKMNAEKWPPNNICMIISINHKNALLKIFYQGLCLVQSDVYSGVNGVIW